MAMKEIRDAVKVLNSLIETCKDGEVGFRSAAETTATPRLASMFGQYSRQRALFASQLQAAVRRLQAEPETGGSLAGAIHRGWVNIKSLATGKDDGVIIAACEWGEDAALKRYEQALATDLPPDIRSIVEGQRAEVKSVHERIRALEIAQGSSDDA